jgi:hypothetical protein
MKGNFVGDPIVQRSALRHDVSEADILHAFRNAFLWWQLDEGMEMHIGASGSGRLLEIGVVIREGVQRIVHAMPARSKFLSKKG